MTGELWIDSKTGTLTGNIKMIYGDANLEPELAYIALGVSETTPNTPVKDYDTAMKTGTDKVLGMLRCKDDANCVWHMPPALPPPPPVETKLATLEAVEATDACNQYLTCNDCIGKAVAGGNTCGWCSQPVVYNTSQPAGPHRCAGHRQSAASGWTCYGVFRTISCSDYVCDPITHQCTEGHGSGSFPTKEGCDQKCKAPPPAPTPCNFAGTYRGIQIDLNYGKGEWDATFSTSGKQTTASFEFVPTGYTYAGDITCSPSKQVTGMGDFQLALTNGTTLYGLYQTGGNQPETEGLSLAFSNDGMTVPPTNFKSAMPGLNASVFGYTKCADYKAGICKF